MSFEEILRIHQGISALARSLIGRPAFNEMHVLLPDPTNPESGFMRATSWLYCLYFEAGRVSIRFLRRLGEAYALLDREMFNQHLETVRCLRTELHHNLGFADSDLLARTAANNWRRRACGTAMPQTLDHWKACYIRIVDDAHTFLGGVDAVVRRIESDRHGAKQHIDEWLRCLNRDWAASEFDPLIDSVKYRMARGALNTVAFRNHNIDKWRKGLDLLEDGFDFDFEATRLIEKTLLNEDSVLLPITGKDVMEGLEIGSGPQVGALLEEARRYFEVHRCSRDELLTHLRRYNDRP